MSKCLVRGCNQPRQKGQVFCRGHWFQVPKPLRDEIWRSYRANDRLANIWAIKEALRLLTRAQAEASDQ